MICVYWFHVLHSAAFVSYVLALCFPILLVGLAPLGTSYCALADDGQYHLSLIPRSASSLLKKVVCLRPYNCTAVGGLVRCVLVHYRVPFTRLCSHIVQDILQTPLLGCALFLLSRLIGGPLFDMLLCMCTASLAY